MRVATRAFDGRALFPESFAGTASARVIRFRLLPEVGESTVARVRDLYLRSDYYTNDERWEVTGTRGFVRVNRCTGRGIQQPSVELYSEGEVRAHHALDDDWGSSFRDSGRHWLRWLHTGEGPLWWSAEEAVELLRFALAVDASSEAGGIGVDPATVT